MTTTTHRQLGSNFYCVHIGGNKGTITIYYSYETPIAFSCSHGDYSFMCRENEWGNTTGKHINSACEMEDRERRNEETNGEEFKQALSEAIYSIL